MKHFHNSVVPSCLCKLNIFGVFFGLLVRQNKQFYNVAQIFTHFTVCVQARFVLKDCIGNNKHCEII